MHIVAVCSLMKRKAGETRVRIILWEYILDKKAGIFAKKWQISLRV